MKSLILFLYFLSIKPKDLALILGEFSQRQPNGKSGKSAEAYQQCKDIVKNMPFKKEFILKTS